MEPITITTVAIAMSTIFSVKASEKTGEKFGEFLSDLVSKSALKLSKKSTLIKNLLQAEEAEPLQISGAILEVKQIADRDPEIAKTISEINTKAKQEPNSQFQSKINQVRLEADKLDNQQPAIQNLTELANKIGVVNQATTINQTINQNIF